MSSDDLSPGLAVLAILEAVKLMKIMFQQKTPHISDSLALAAVVERTEYVTLVMVAVVDLV